MRRPFGGTNPLEPGKDHRVADGSRIFDAREDRDPTALAALYRAHARYVWRVLRHCGVPDADLDDAVQETFLVVFRRLPDFAARASLRTWIYAVAVRVAATRRRSQRREAARREHAGHDMHGAGAVDPEVALSKAEAAELVDRLLDELDAQKRTVLVLAELEGVKVPEISRILGVNPHTVQSRLRLARASFGSALERMKAREANDRRVARLRPRALLDHAAGDRPPASRRKAAMAAVAVRIEQGAMPTLAGWKGLALGSGAGGWTLPVTLLGVLGTVAMAAVLATGATGSPKPGAGARASMDAREDEPPAHPADSRSAGPDAPTVRTGSMIDVPFEPKAGSATAASSDGDPFGQPRMAREPPRSPIVRTGATIEHVGIERKQSTTPSRADDSRREPANAATGSSAPSALPPSTFPATAAAESSLAAETHLLEQARSALHRGELEAAFAALDRHAADHPEGLLLNEARSTRLRALCAAGRTDAAVALADRLAPGQLGSRWHDVVAAACR